MLTCVCASSWEQVLLSLFLFLFFFSCWYSLRYSFSSLSVWYCLFLVLFLCKGWWKRSRLFVRFFITLSFSWRFISFIYFAVLSTLFLKFYFPSFTSFPSSFSLIILLCPFIFTSVFGPLKISDVRGRSLDLTSAQSRSFRKLQLVLLQTTKFCHFLSLHFVFRAPLNYPFFLFSLLWFLVHQFLSLFFYVSFVTSFLFFCVLFQ